MEQQQKKTLLFPFGLVCEFVAHAARGMRLANFVHAEVAAKCTKLNFWLMVTFPSCRANRTIDKKYIIAFGVGWPVKGEVRSA